MGATAAERMRKSRARRRSGLAIVRVEVDFDLIDALVEHGHLAAWDADDGVAVADAIGRLLRVTLAESDFR